MATGFYARSIAIMTSLYGLLFGFIGVVGFVVTTSGDFEARINSISFGLIAMVALGFLFLQFLISPWLMDLQLRWIYDMSWITIDQLPRSMANAIKQTVDQYGFTLGKIGLIHDGMPNAFTYGRFRNGARIVFTQGIIDLLGPEEQAAVTQHEMGHIVNYDFAFMTLASAIPLLFYYFYRTGRSIANSMSRNKSGGSSDNKSGQVVLVIYAIVVLAYVIYTISRFIVLLLSRYREHAADTFSANATKEPGSLSSALVKIAYGLVTNEQKVQQKLENDDIDRSTRKQLQNRRGYSNAMSAMGLADVNMSRGLVMQAAAGGGEVSPETVAKAATWDLQTPWAKFIELQSTHPLTGKRLKALDDVAETMEIPRKYPDLGKVSPPESLWDEFLMDLFVGYILPWLIFLIPLVSIIVSAFTEAEIGQALGISFVILAALWLLRVSIKYPGSINRYTDPNKTPNTVLEALSSMERDGYYEASPIRGKPIIIEGIVGGRGQPGYILSEDFMVRDNTGFIVVNYSSIIPLYNLWFGWKHVKQMMGEKVRIVGWYHRGIMPSIQLHRLIRADGTVKKNRWRGLNLVFVAILFFLGLIFMSGIITI